MIEYWQVSDAMREAFKGHGRALRTKDEPPLDGEPWMSMEDARSEACKVTMQLLKNFQR